MGWFGGNPPRRPGDRRGRVKVMVTYTCQQCGKTIGRGHTWMYAEASPTTGITSPSGFCRRCARQQVRQGRGHWNEHRGQYEADKPSGGYNSENHRGRGRR